MKRNPPRPTRQSTSLPCPTFSRAAPLRHEARGAGLARVQTVLDIGFAQCDLRRRAIDDTAQGRPVTLAPGGDAEEPAKAVIGHRSAYSAFLPPSEIGRAHV